MGSRKLSSHILFAAACLAASHTASANPKEYVSVADTLPYSGSIPANDVVTASGYGQHYAAQPSTQWSYIVVFLSATGTQPSYYTDFLDEAGVGTVSDYSGTVQYSVNYASIGLAFMNGGTVGATVSARCNTTDACYTNARGETTFGRNAVYPGWPSTQAYNADAYPDTNNPTVLQGDSIVNRLVLALDYLSWQTATPTNPHPSYWRNFLLDDTAAMPLAQNCYVGSGATSATTACFVAPHDINGTVNYSRKVVPDWSKIIIAGHSQGGGNAAFLAMKLPTAAHRVLLFSSPQDVTATSPTPTPAGWITGSTGTPLANFWGLRNDNEGAYGNQVDNNWSQLGAATASGGLGGTSHNAKSNVVDGSTAPSAGSQNFYITSPDVSPFTNHCSTAMNVAYQTTVKKTWDWMLTGGGSAY